MYLNVIMFWVSIKIIPLIYIASVRKFSCANPKHMVLLHSLAKIHFNLHSYNEPLHKKTNNMHRLISIFVFTTHATQIVQSLFLNPDFQAASLILWLYSLVCVGPGRKP